MVLGTQNRLHYYAIKPEEFRLLVNAASVVFAGQPLTVVVKGVFATKRGEIVVLKDDDHRVDVSALGKSRFIPLVINGTMRCYYYPDLIEELLIVPAADGGTTHE
jgi:hypothetical protein